MKQFNTVHKTISGADFYISPFPAMVAANLSAEVFAAISPIISSLIPIATAVSSQTEGNTIEEKRESATRRARELVDNDMGKYLPQVVSALNALSGDKLEGLLSKLLVLNHNIACEYDYEDERGDTRHVKGQLNKDMLNEIFCMDVLGLYRLALEVIILNYGSFFGSLTGLFGGVGQEEVIRI